jgi:RHS repeat-associated protein
VIQFHYDSRGLPIAISGPDLGNGRRVYARFYYRQINTSITAPSDLGNSAPPPITVNFPALEALVFPGNMTGYVFSDFTPFGIPKTVSVNRQMTISTDSLTDQGSYTSGQNTKHSTFNYPDDVAYFNKTRLLPLYSQRVDTWADPITNSTQQSTTTYSGTSELSTVTLPDGSSSVQASITADSTRWDYGLADWTRTIGSDGKWLKTTHYLWEPGESIGDVIVPHLKEVQVENHEINAVQRTEFHYGANNKQVTEKIQHAYASPANLNAAPVTVHTVKQYLNQAAYLASNFNLVSQYSVFDGNISTNPAYTQWQQQLAQLQQILNQAQNNAMGPQQAVNTAQAAYDTEADNEPETTLPNGKPNTLHAKWVTAMAKLKAQLDAAKANAAATQQAVATAQANYSSLAASAPPQTIEHEIERTNFQFDAPTLIALNPKPTNYSPNINPFAARGLITQTTRWLAPNAKAIYEASGDLRAVNTSYIYDETGNLREVHLSPNSVTRYGYDVNSQYSLPTSVTTGSTDPASPAQLINGATYDLGTGLTLTKTDADHQVTQNGYVPGSTTWRPGSARFATGVAASYTYGDDTLSVETKLTDAEGHQYVQESYVDGRGLLRRTLTTRAGSASTNPAYTQWQQQLAQLQQVLDQAKSNAASSQQAGNAAQAAYDTEAGNEPDATIDNGHGAHKPNPAHAVWAKAMAKLQAQLDAAKANAAAAQQAVVTAQANYNSLAASAPQKTVALASDIQEYRYDTMGRTSQTMATKRSSESLPERWTQYSYDPAGRLSAIKDPSGSVNSWFYNESTYSKLANGQLGDSVRSVDPWQHESWALSDGMGRKLIRVISDPTTGKVADAGSTSFDYQYDVKNRPLQIRQYSLSGAVNPQLRTYHYDSLGRLIGTVVPERDATLDVSGNYHASGGLYSDVYAYDDLSNMILHIDSRGAKTNFHFNGDPLNRIQGVDYDLSSVGDNSSPIAAVPPTTFAYVPALQGDPRRTQSVTTQGVLQVGSTYDAFGRQATMTWAFPGLGASWKLASETHYDSLSRPQSFSYPARYQAGQLKDGPRLDYRYTVDGELAEMDLDGAALVRNIDNGVQGVRHLDLFNSGVKIGEDNVFDPLSGRGTQQSVTGAAQGILLQLGYAYHDATHVGETGQILTQSDSKDIQQTRRNEYDAWGRLQSSYLGPEPATADTTRQDYTYDAFGNRLSSTGSRFVPASNSWVRWDGLADGTSPGIESSTNRITQSGYLYDKAGNLIQRPDDAGGQQRYFYDAAERLVRVENGTGALLETYLYGADRRRIGTSADANHWRLSLWNGFTELGRYDRNPTDATLNWIDMPIYIGGRLLADISQQTGNTSAMTMYHPDQRGTSLKTTVSASGVVTATRESLRSFGTENATVTPTDDERIFTSYRRSARTGLDYAINRFYDPKLGRFIQPDPAASGNNLYAYAAGDPMNKVDPLGLAATASGCGMLPGDRWVWGNCVSGTSQSGSQQSAGNSASGDGWKAWPEWTQSSAPPEEAGQTNTTDPAEEVSSDTTYVPIQEEANAPTQEEWRTWGGLANATFFPNTSTSEEENLFTPIVPEITTGLPPMTQPDIPTLSQGTYDPNLGVWPADTRTPDERMLDQINGRNEEVQPYQELFGDKLLEMIEARERGMEGRDSNTDFPIMTPVPVILH